MNLRTVRVAGAIALTAIACLFIGARDVGAAHARNAPVLKYLWPALKYGETVGRIYYRASCQPDSYVRIPFPHLDVERPPNRSTGVAAVREIFRRVSDVSVTEPETGVIRVRIGSVPETVLPVRIRKVVLSPQQQYNMWLAVAAIQEAPEVQSVMRQLKLRSVGKPINIHLVRPASDLPHLPAVLTNLTMDQAFDAVAKTWRVIVLYGFCSPPSQYDIDIADAADIYSTEDKVSGPESGP